MVTVSTSFASGTVSSVSGTTITLATGTAVAGWVGRVFVLNRNITNVPRSGQWREITAVNSTTSITIDYPWKTADSLGLDAIYTPKVEAINTSTDQITITAHDFVSGEYIGVYAAGENPGGTSQTVLYYCKAIDANTIELHTNETLSSVVNLSDSGIGDVYIVRDPDLEGLPQAGDAFHISHELDDIDNGSTLVKVDSFLYRRAGTCTFSGNVTVYAKSLAIDFGAPSDTTMRLDVGAGIILGAYNEFGQGVRGCVVIYSNTGGNPNNLWGGSTGLTAGDVQMFGCQIIANTTISTSYFQRLYRGAGQIVRFVDCTISGNFGGRFSGSRSTLRRTIYTGSSSTIGPFTTAAPFGEIREIKSVDTLQAAYWFWADSGSGVIKNLLAKNLSDKFISISHGSSPGSTFRTLRVVDTDWDGSGSAFLQVINISETVTNKFVEYGFSFNIQSFVSGVLGGGHRVAIFNSLGAEVFNGLSSDGTTPELFLIQRRFTLPSSGSAAQNIAFSSGELRSPHSLRIRQFGFVSLQETLPTDQPQSYRWNKAEDIFITAVGATAALSVTNPTTANQIYDHSQATYASSGYMQYDEIITTADGVTLNLDCNVEIDFTETAIGYTPATPAITVSAFSPGTFVVLRISANRKLTLAQATTYSAPFSISPTGIVEVTNGTTILLATQFDSGATLDNLGDSEATVIVAQGQSPTVESPSTGGGAIILQNRLTITLAIILNTGTTPAASVIVIRSDGTPAILNYASNNTGVYTYTYTYPAGETPDLVIRVGQPGFTVAERLVNDADGDISFAIELVQKITLDGPQYTAVLSSGVSLVVDTTNLVGPTANDHRIRLDGSFDARILSNELEVLKSTESGLSVWDLFGSDFAVSPTGGQSFSISPSVTVERLSGATSSVVRGFLARFDGSNPVDETNGPVSFATVEGLAPQAIRDAMTLERTVGLTPGANSVDGLIVAATIDDQTLADSLKLAPTAGTPATGSVYAELDSLLAGTGGSLSYDLPQFIALMRADAAFKRALSDGALILGLADELALIKTQVWTRSDVRTAWNTLITNAGVTAPSVGEVSAWNSYAALLPGLSFASTGEVSYAG